MGVTDEYPSWALPLVYQRMLWKEYGIRVDADFTDVLLMIRLHNLEADRAAYEQDRLNRDTSRQ